MLRAFLNGSVIASTNDIQGRVLIVGLHGWSRNSKDFTDLSRFLEAQGIVFVAPDLPGFGESQAPLTAWGTDDYAHCIDQLISELLIETNYDKVIVVGHSFGGRIALKLAASNPTYLSDIVVMGTPLFRNSPSVKLPIKLRLAKALARISLVSDSQIESIKSRYGSRDYRAASGVMRDILVRSVNEDYSNALLSIDIPVTFIWGELDSAAPLQDAKRALAMVSNSSLSIIAEGDHFSPLLDGMFIQDLLLKIAGKEAFEKGAGDHTQEDSV